MSDLYASIKKRPVKLVDPKCYELAEHFLADHKGPTEEHKRLLSEAIQDAVEDYFNGMKLGEQFSEAFNIYLAKNAPPPRMPVLPLEVALSEENDALIAENKALREALEPFAKEAITEGNIRLSLGADIDHWPIGSNSLTLGDLRRARSALTSKAST